MNEWEDFKRFDPEATISQAEYNAIRNYDIAMREFMHVLPRVYLDYATPEDQRSTDEASPDGGEWCESSININPRKGDCGKLSRSGYVQSFFTMPEKGTPMCELTQPGDKIDVMHVNFSYWVPHGEEKDVRLLKWTYQSFSAWFPNLISSHKENTFSLLKSACFLL